MNKTKNMIHVNNGVGGWENIGLKPTVLEERMNLKALAPNCY